MSARGPSRRTRNMRRTCLVFHSTPGLPRTEDLAALCAPLRQEPERSTTMPSLSEIAGDERTARMVLSMVVEPEDAVTGRLLATVGGVETLRLAESDGPVPGIGDVDAQVWRGHFAAPGIDSLDERLLQSTTNGVRLLDPWRRRMAPLARRSRRAGSIRALDSWVVVVPRAPARRPCDHHRRASRNLLRRARRRDARLRPGCRRADRRCRRCIRHRRCRPSCSARDRWRHHRSPGERS